MGSLTRMQTSAAAIVGIAVVVLIGIAITEQFKTLALIDNATADLFIAGLAIFGSFMGIIVLAIVGKLVIGLFTQSKGE